MARMFSNTIRGLMVVYITVCCFTSARGQLSGYFWHISDFHMDLNYSTYGDPSQMCWESSGNQDGGNSVKPGGVFGDYRCDSPFRLVRSALDAMKKLGPKPDFVLWTGDDTAHVSDDFFSTDKVFSLIQNLTDEIRATFPNVPLVPVMGNHDWYKKHQLPASSDILYKRIAKLWEDWIGPDGSNSFAKGGFYTTLLPSKVRVVALNTAIYYQKNQKVDKSLDDPAGQFAWFDRVMQDATNNGEKVYVTSHVPPGVFERHIIPKGFTWISPKYNKKYIDLIIKHSGSILGQFYAHHHTDSFRVFYNSTGVPVSWLLVAPAVTPWNTTLSQVGPNNPALRLINYKQGSGQITNFQQYFLNLSLANERNTADWQLEYDAQKDYGVSEVSPAELDRVAQSFATENRSLFDKYYLYNSVSYDPASSCNSVCQHYHYCVITNVDFDKFEACRTSGGGPIATGYLRMYADRWNHGNRHSVPLPHWRNLPLPSTTRSGHD